MRSAWAPPRIAPRRGRKPAPRVRCAPTWIPRTQVSFTASSAKGTPTPLPDRRCGASLHQQTSSHTDVHRSAERAHSAARVRAATAVARCLASTSRAKCCLVAQGQRRATRQRVCAAPATTQQPRERGAAPALPAHSAAAARRITTALMARVSVAQRSMCFPHSSCRQASIHSSPCLPTQLSCCASWYSS